MTDTAQMKTDEVKTSNMETQSALPPEETERLSTEIVAALKTVFDPEIPADIYELGLIYKVDISDERAVDVTMTLTTPMCPLSEYIEAEVQNTLVGNVPGVTDTKVNLVWTPPWDPSKMSEDAKLELGFW